MRHLVSRNTQIAYKWGNGGVGWPLVESDVMLVIEEMLAPGCSEKLHYHNHAAQCFYMLMGNAVMQFADDQHVDIEEGMALYISPKTSHAIVNQSSDKIRFLVISTPSTLNDRVNLDDDK